MQQQPDNWNTRILCGPRCLDQNKYQITKESFQYTLNRLRLFEDVLFVEELTKSYDKFTKKHNWPAAPIDAENEAPNSQASITLTGEMQKEWNPLMSALDDALYEFGHRMDAQIEPYDNFTHPVQKQLDHYFEYGQLQNCTTICCGDKCSTYR